MDERILLDVSKHCIETAARNAYRRLLDYMLQSEELTPKTEVQIDILREFLQRSDFRKLRSNYPELAGGTSIQVELNRTTSGEISWRVVREP